MNLNPIFLASITSICWGLSNGYMKYPSIYLGSPKAISMRQIMMFSLLASLNVLFLNLEFDARDYYWIGYTIILGLFGYFPFLLFCEALKSGSVGVVNAIGNSFPIIVVLLGYFFFNLQFTKIHFLGISLTTLGIILLSIFSLPQKKQVQKAIYTSTQVNIFSLSACILWGVFFTLVQNPNQQLGYLRFAAFIQLGSFISAYLHLILQRYKSKKNFNKQVGKKSLVAVMLAAFFAVIGSASYYKALTIGNPGIVTAIAGCSPIIGALFGRVIYREMLSIKQLFGIFLSVIGVMVLGFF